MASSYENKYPKILIDTQDQSANPHTKKELTVEEWYDMLHHSHQEFSNGDIGSTPPLTDENAAQILNKLNEITASIQAVTSDIASIKSRINAIDAYIEQDIQVEESDIL